jgi:hypothetical protein
MQGVRRLREVQGCEPKQGSERLLLQGVHRVEKLQLLVKVEGFPQGVHAKSFLFLRDRVTVEVQEG